MHFKRLHKKKQVGAYTTSSGNKRPRTNHHRHEEPNVARKRGGKRVSFSSVLENKKRVVYITEKLNLYEKRIGTFHLLSKTEHPLFERSFIGNS